MESTDSDSGENRPSPAKKETTKKKTNVSGGGRGRGRGAETGGRGRGRKHNVDPNAPQKPKSGYVLYITEKRSELMKENPDLSIGEMNKTCGNKWQGLSMQQKQEYLEQAADLRKKYDKALEEYRQTESYRQFKETCDEKKIQSGGVETEFAEDLKPGDIPIFTKEFLEHNRQREEQLRDLRKQVTQLEDEQGNLESRIQQLETATNHMEMETEEAKQRNLTTKKQLEDTRTLLTNAFSKLPLPDTGEVPTVNTIDRYMCSVHKMILDSPNENQDFIAKARNILARCKLSIS